MILKDNYRLTTPTRGTSSRNFVNHFINESYAIVLNPKVEGDHIYVVGNAGYFVKESDLPSVWCFTDFSTSQRCKDFFDAHSDEIVISTTETIKDCWTI